MNANLNELRGGAIAINKPSGMTSHDVVGAIRKLFHTRKVGHTGTLDPMATGVLVVLVGRAVKACDLVMSSEKSYVAEMKLGITSDTEDISGKLVYTGTPIPKRDDVISTALSFLGESMQVPPMYSALKVGGKKLVDLARQGIEIEREPRPITIYSISAEGDGDTYSLDVTCSKGTYIRTLCADIGKSLGCGAVMSALKRSTCGGFDIEDAYTIEQLTDMTDEERMNALSPCEKLFSSLQSVRLPNFYARLFKNGSEIYQHKIKTAFNMGDLLRVYDDDGFIAIGEVRDFDGKSAIKVKAFL